MKHIWRIILLSLCISVFSPSCLAQSTKNGEAVLRRVHALLKDFDSLYTFEPVKARTIVNQALSLSRMEGLPKEYADSYSRLGNLHFNIGQYDSAKFCFEQAKIVYENNNNTKGIILCYKDLGNVLVETGNLEQSLDYYTRGLKLAKKNNFDELKTLFINNIGLIYLKQEHLEKALQHFEESASLNSKGYYHAIAINNIGIVKQQQGKLTEAITYYEQSLKACLEINDEYCTLTPLNSLAGLYLKQQDFDKSLESSEKIIETQKKLGLEKDLLVSYNRMGLIYNQKDNYDLAIFYYNKSLAIAKQLNSGLTPYIYANLSDAYANNGQYEEALKHSIRFYEMRDSIYSLDYKVRTEELLKQYETEKSEKEISLLKKDRRLKQIEMENKQALYTKELLKKNLEEQENKYKLLHKNRQIGLLEKDKEIQQAKIKNKQIELDRQTFIRNIAIVSAVLIFIPTFILMIVYQQKVRNTALLALKTEEVNKQKTLELLRSFEIKTIKANIEGQEKEKQRLAKELHDGVAGSLAGIKMRFQSMESLLNENPPLRRLMHSVDDVYKEVRTISHHLTPPGMLEYSFVGFMKKYLNEISESAKFDVEYIFDGERDLNLLSDDIKVEIYRILQELISNIIKHAQADFVEVQIIKNEEGLSLIIEDRGKGFDSASKSAGLGLISIKSRVDALGGELYIDSVPKRGTLVNVNIPVA